MCTGEISGLPKGSIKKGHVHILHYHKPYAKLTLSCKCSIYQPLWQVYEVDTQSLSKPFANDVQCMNLTSGYFCAEEITFISQKQKGIFLHATEEFTINQSTVLMCYSSFHREIAIITVSGRYFSFLSLMF